MELRKRGADGGGGMQPDAFVQLASSCRKIIVFSGSGLSASAGMSMFSTRNGLYDRARKKFKVQDGIKLFTYGFYKQQREEAQAFFSEIYSEAQASHAAPGHYALAEIHAMQRMKRHYTLNIDGLAEVVGMDTWHCDRNPSGVTVEMHGNIRQLVCPTCCCAQPVSRSYASALRAKQALRCPSCGADDLRFKVMLYDDDEGSCVTPEHVFEVLEEDLEDADLILWVGISFAQQASVDYFRRVRSLLQRRSKGQQAGACGRGSGGSRGGGAGAGGRGTRDGPGGGGAGAGGMDAGGDGCGAGRSMGVGSGRQGEGQGQEIGTAAVGTGLSVEEGSPGVRQTADSEGLGGGGGGVMGADRRLWQMGGSLDLGLGCGSGGGMEASAGGQGMRQLEGNLGGSGGGRGASAGGCPRAPVLQALVNPSDEAYCNLVSACCNTHDLQLLDVRATSDELLPLLVKAMRSVASGTAAAAVTAGAAATARPAGAAGAAGTAGTAGASDAPGSSLSRPGRRDRSRVHGGDGSGAAAVPERLLRKREPPRSRLLPPSIPPLPVLRPRAPAAAATAAPPSLLPASSLCSTSYSVPLVAACSTSCSVPLVAAVEAHHSQFQGSSTASEQLAGERGLGSGGRPSAHGQRGTYEAPLVAPVGPRSQLQGSRGAAMQPAGERVLGGGGRPSAHGQRGTYEAPLVAPVGPQSGARISSGGQAEGKGGGGGEAGPPAAAAAMVAAVADGQGGGQGAVGQARASAGEAVAAVLIGVGLGGVAGSGRHAGVAARVEEGEEEEEEGDGEGPEEGEGSAEGLEEGEGAFEAREEGPEAVAGDEEELEEGVFEVERLLARRTRRQGGERWAEFLVRWAGYGPEHDTWEPEDNILAVELLARFEASG